MEHSLGFGVERQTTTTTVKVPFIPMDGVYEVHFYRRQSWCLVPKNANKKGSDIKRESKKEKEQK